MLSPVAPPAASPLPPRIEIPGNGSERAIPPTTPEERLTVTPPPSPPSPVSSAPVFLPVLPPTLQRSGLTSRRGSISEVPATPAPTPHLGMNAPSSGFSFHSVPPGIQKGWESAKRGVNTVLEDRRCQNCLQLSGKALKAMAVYSLKITTAVSKSVASKSEEWTKSLEDKPLTRARLKRTE